MVRGTNARDLENIRRLAQERWNKIKDDKKHPWSKEDALVYAWEMYDEYDDVDLLSDEYDDLLNSIV